MQSFDCLKHYFNIKSIDIIDIDEYSPSSDLETATRYAHPRHEAAM
jgi:hypothetical protein